jgi:hypothetical protein
MLLPNALRIRDDFPFVLKRSIPVAALIIKPVPVNDWAMAMASDKPPRMVRLYLNEWAEAEADDFRRVHGGGNCSCHISPPCCSCMHPGNPFNLNETEDAWVMGPEGSES